MTFTLTFNPLRTVVMRRVHMQTFCVNGQSVQKTEWKQTDGQTGRQTDGGDCITLLANAVGNCTTDVEHVLKHAFVPFNNLLQVSVQRTCGVEQSVISLERE